MSATITVPVNVSPEAADFISGRRVQDPLERILGKIQELVPGLRRIDILVAPAYEPDEEPKLDILAFAVGLDPATDASIYDRFTTWKVTTFPCEVATQFLFTLLDEETRAG